MSKQWKAKRAGSDAGGGAGGRWRCFRCDGPDAPWRESNDPRQAVRYHRARYH